jgi:glycosyltransferase involved in cell wall biosynthesis
MPSRPNREAGISLIIPCFNAAAFVGEALESAFGQTVVPDEILVVDDGSTDSSADVVRGFGDSVRYVHQDNAGEPAARNTGIRQSRHALVAFLDADDIWPSDSLRTRLLLLQSAPDAHFAFGVTEQFHDSSCERATHAVPPVAAPLAGATLFRRDAFRAVGDFDTSIRLGAMMDWYSRASHHGLASVTTQTIVLRRRIHQSNSVHDGVQLRAGYLRALRAAARRNKAAQE